MEPDDLEIFASLRSNQINPFNRPNMSNISNMIGGGITTTPYAAMFLDDAGLPPIDPLYGVANEEDDKDDIEKAKQITNGRGLLSLLNPFSVLGPVGSFIGGGGLKGLQNFSSGLQNTAFGRSKTLAEFFDRVSREKNRARFQDKFEKFAKETSGQGATGGEGGFSTPAGKSTSYEEAGRAFGRNR